MPDRSPPRPSLGRRTSACPGEGREPAEIILADPAWRRAVPYLQRRVARAIATGGGAGTVLLSSDRAVRALNRQHRGIDKPTNVLTFDPAYPGAGGDIVLAYGVMRREAHAAGRTLAAHLAHLLIHGALHLQGEDHHGVGEARRMEMLEARLLHRLHIPNPWKPAIVRPT